VVRFENMVLSPSKVAAVLSWKLRRRMGLHAPHARRLEKVDLKRGAKANLWTPLDVHRQGRSKPVNITGLASACRAVEPCRVAVTPFIAVVAALGYDLVHPEDSALGGKQGPFVENLAAVLDSYGIHAPQASSCSDSLGASCGSYEKSLMPFPSPCLSMEAHA